MQSTGGYPPTSQSPIVQGYPRGAHPHHAPPPYIARTRQQLHAQTVQFSPSDSAYLPSPLESPVFRVEGSFGGQHSPAVSVGHSGTTSSVELSPYPSYDGGDNGGGFGQPSGGPQNDLYPFNSRPPDMSTSLSSAWSYPITTPPSSAASSFRNCVSRSTSPSAASVISTYSSAASTASAPQGYHAMPSTRAVRSSPYHFRNRATSTPSLTAPGSSAGSFSFGPAKVPTPRSGKIMSKLVIAGDRSAAQRNKAKLTDAQKKEICTLKLETPTIRQDDLAARFGVERSTVSKILKDTARWMNPAAWLPERRKEALSAPSAVPCVSSWRFGSGVSGFADVLFFSLFLSSITRFLELEGPLTVWLHALIANGSPQPVDLEIKEQALSIAASLGWPSEKFKASSGWLDGFKARHDLFRHGQGSSSEGTPSAPTSRRSSPVKRVFPMTAGSSSASSAAPSTANSPAPSPATGSAPTLKEGFEYTARKRSSSSVSLRGGVPALPTVLEDSHYIAQPLPRRAGQLGRSESLAMMSSMENVSLAPTPAKLTPNRPGLSPLTPSSSAGHRGLPQRSISFPLGSISGPATPASVEGSLGIATTSYVSASPSEPPPPAAPFEARRHHQRLHSLSGLHSPSNYQRESFADNAWFSHAPNRQIQHSHGQQQYFADHLQSQQQPYPPQGAMMAPAFAPPPIQVDANPVFAADGSVHYASAYGSYPAEDPGDLPPGLEHPTFILSGSAAGPAISSGPPAEYHPGPLSASPSHSAVPSRLASPAGGVTGGAGFPRTRSYTGSSLAMTSTYAAADYPPAHPHVAYYHAESVSHSPAVGYDQPVAEQTEVCFEWGDH